MSIGINENDHESFNDIWTKLNEDLEDLVRKYKGDTEPTYPEPLMWWFKSDDSILKLRNADNDAWIDMFYVDDSDNIHTVGPLGIHQGSDTFTLSLSGGKLIAKTDVDTNTDTALALQGKGTGKGVLELWDQSSTYKMAHQPPDSLTADVTYTWPTADGSDGQALTTDGSGTLSWAAGGGGTPKGYNIGWNVDYVGTSSVSVSTGVLECDGDEYECTSSLTVNLSGLSNSTWYGLAFIPGNYVSTVSAGCFEKVNTASFAYSGSKHAWYCTADGKTSNRVVGLFNTSSSGSIIDYRIIDGWFRYLDDGNPGYWTFASTSSPPQTFTAVSTGVPGLSRRFLVEIQGYAYKAGSWPQLSIANGESAATSGDRQYPTQIVNEVTQGSTASGMGVRVTDTSGQIKYYCAQSGMTVKLGLRGFKMPEGM